MLMEKDIPKLTRAGNYEIDVPLGFLMESIRRYKEEYNLDLNPDFQRAHVWTEEKQIKYIEFLFRGGVSSRVIYFNCKGWSGSFEGPMILVDGKQRLEALRRFFEGEIGIFGGYKVSNVDRRIYKLSITMRFNINDLPTRKAVLQWYLDLNDGGVAHTSKEIEKVRKLLTMEKSKYE